MEKNVPLRIGVVGCGRISEKHVEAIKSFPGAATLAAICDVDEAALRKTYESSAALLRFSNLEDLLKSGEVDLVSLCTPSGLHAEQAILAARHGVHVISEKPMAIRATDGIRMNEECRKHGVRLFVVKQNRYNPTIRALKNAIQEGRLGRLFMINCNVFWSRPQSYYDQAPWRGTWHLDGGAFMNQASHYVDLLNWLAGPVESVWAATDTLARKIEVEDTGSAVFRFTSGAIGSLNVTMLAHEKNYEGSITVIGEKGTVKLGGVAANNVVTWDLQGLSKTEQEEIIKSSYEVSSVYGNGHRIYYEHVIKALQGVSNDIIDGEDGLVSLKVLEAIYQSAKMETVVKLNEVNGANQVFRSFQFSC